jgi:hypothetical protein
MRVYVYVYALQGFMVFKGINSVFGSCSVEIVWTNRTLTNFRFFFIPFYFCVFILVLD